MSDINDNAPQFHQSAYSVQVSEALDTGSAVLNLLATDADYGSNAEIQYAIIDQQPDLGKASHLYIAQSKLQEGTGILG